MIKESKEYGDPIPLVFTCLGHVIGKAALEQLYPICTCMARDVLLPSQAGLAGNRLSPVAALELRPQLVIPLSVTRLFPAESADALLFCSSHFSKGLSTIHPETNRFSYAGEAKNTCCPGVCGVCVAPADRDADVCQIVRTAWVEVDVSRR